MLVLTSKKPWNQYGTLQDLGINLATSPINLTHWKEPVLRLLKLCDGISSYLERTTHDPRVELGSIFNSALSNSFEDPDSYIIRNLAGLNVFRYQVVSQDLVWDFRLDSFKSFLTRHGTILVSESPNFVIPPLQIACWFGEQLRND